MCGVCEILRQPGAQPPTQHHRRVAIARPVCIWLTLKAEREAALLQQIERMEQDLAALSSAVAILCRRQVAEGDDEDVSAELTSVRRLARKIGRVH